MTRRFLAPLRRAAVLTVVACAATVAHAQPISAPDSAFYLSVNLEAMKQGQASAPLYAFFDDEILDELRDEFGTDLVDSLEGVSLFGSGPDQMPVVVLHGEIPRSARDRIVDQLFREHDDVELLTDQGRNYYAFGGLDLDWDGPRFKTGEGHDALFLAFGEAGQTLITPDRTTLDDFLASGGLPEAVMSSELVVIQADRALAQGGLNGRHAVFGGSGGPWESEVFRKVDRLALLVAEGTTGLEIAVEAHSASSEVAQALQNIVQGIISLKALSSEVPKEFEWLDGVRISRDDHITRLDVAIPSSTLVEILD